MTTRYSDTEMNNGMRRRHSLTTATKRRGVCSADEPARAVNAIMRSSVDVHGKGSGGAYRDPIRTTAMKHIETTGHDRLGERMFV